jgi:hypothetical protein
MLRTVYQNVRANDNNISIRLIDGECNIYTIQNAKMVQRNVDNIMDALR